MRGRLEATANLFFNLRKNPTSPTVAGFATKNNHESKSVEGIK